MYLTRRGFLAGSLGAMALPAHAQGASLRVIQSGHSLTDPIIEPLKAMLRARGIRGRLDRSTIPGSPMEWRWNNAPDVDRNARDPAVIADYDRLVITERIPLSGTSPWHDSKGFLLRWAEHAWRHGNGGQGAATVLYATWVELTSGTAQARTDADPEAHIPFRDRLPREMAGWREMAQHASAHGPKGMPKIKIIPGPLLMAEAFDQIEAGKAPGLTSIKGLFADEIHVNALGAYLISLAHLAVIYDQDPRGLRAPRGGPDPQQAAWMEDLVNKVLSGFDW